MSALVPRTKVLGLYRQMLKASHGFQDYGFKSYAQRRVRAGFEENRGVTDAAKQHELIESAKKDLKLLQRQSLINQMYSPGTYFMDTLPKHH